MSGNGSGGLFYEWQINGFCFNRIFSRDKKRRLRVKAILLGCFAVVKKQNTKGNQVL
jgi:hypothetical protein